VQPLLSIVIPAFNEERRLPDTLGWIGDFLAARDDWRPTELVVVDDGSSDRTAAVARDFVPPAGIELAVLALGANRGKGAAVRAGLAAARGARVLISDADLATPIEELDTLAARAVPLAVGSRAVRRELIGNRQPLLRDLMGRSFNVFLRLLGLTALRDTQCGFKLLDGDLARRLAGELRLDGFAFDVELLARAVRAGAAIAEVPVRWNHVEESRVRPLRHGLAMLADAVRVRVWLWRGL
jgi:dolichyl-phosphate beta-glucosyltransferase